MTTCKNIEVVDIKYQVSWGESFVMITYKKEPAEMAKNTKEDKKNSVEIETVKEENPN